MNKNNTTIMFGVLFSSMILLTTATILQQQDAHANPIITNFGNGYADGKHAAQNTFIQADTVTQATQYLSGTTYRIAQHIT